MSKAYMAKKQFDENFQSFGNAQTAPEKFNLYGGLSNLAGAIQGLEGEIAQLKRAIADIQNRIK